jgi:hypothetical protein
MVALAESAALWSPVNSPATADSGFGGHTPESSFGLNLSDFKVFICQQDPELDQSEIHSIAVNLKNDITNFMNGTRVAESAALDTNNDTTRIPPTQVIAYAVHKIRETGEPFEGTPAWGRVNSAIDEYFLQVGLNVEAPAFAQLKFDTLLTA